MTTYIPDALRREVSERADYRCEYCYIHQDDRFYTHEIDHIIAEKHGGQTQNDNLSLACSECNRYKGSEFCSLDTETHTIVSLFHPRLNHWSDHFYVVEGVIEAITPTGRVTARLLKFNQLDAIDRRRLLTKLGRYP